MGIRNIIAKLVRHVRESHISRKCARWQLRECNAIIRTIKPKKKLTRLEVKQVKSYYKDLIGCRVSTKWHKLYLNTSNRFDCRYIPLDLLFSKILPALNNPILSPAYADKGQYERLFPMIKHPYTVFKRINGDYYLNDTIVDKGTIVSSFPNKGTYILKPILNTSRGDGVVAINAEDFRDQDEIVKFLDEQGVNYILQEKIQSHPDISVLNPSSLNTVRVITYRHGINVVILSVTLKIGKTGEIVDNGHHGGFFCSVNENGELGHYLYHLVPFTKSDKTESGVVIRNRKIPHFDRMTQVVCECARRLPYTKYVGWDLAIDISGEPVLIEINVKSPGGNIMQIPNGPLFGHHTEEILNEVFRHD